MTIRRTIGAVAAGVAAIALSLTGVSAAQAADRVSFAGSVPSWATPANDQGAAAADTTVEGELYLPLRNAQAATALATAVSTPGVGYRLSVSPQQWISRFSPTQASLDAAVGYLKSQGLTITATPQSRLYVVYRGTVEQLGAAFGTSLHRYSYAGTTLVAPSSAPSVPSSIGTTVAGISLDQAKLLTHPDSIQQGDLGSSGDPKLFQRKAAAAPVVDTPCSQYIGEHVVTVPPSYGGQTQYSTFDCGYTPAQLRSAYGVSDLKTNGAGQTVAIIDAYASPSIVSDVNTYSAKVGEPGLSSATYQQIVPTPAQFSDQALCEQPSGWQGEQTLDVGGVHSMAPGAKILYVGGYNCGGGLDIALSTILDGRLATVVSNSYSDGGEALPADVLQGEQNLYLQAAAEGIGLYFSSGDNGDGTVLNDSVQPEFPASDPWVTAVGGTALAIDSRGKVAYETGWGDTVDQITKDASGALTYAESLPGTRFVGGAGGSVSTVFAQPSYQRGIVPAALAQGKRVVPDVAADADPYTGFLIGLRPILDDSTLQTGAFVNETYGGTSLASPLVAAQVAIVQASTHQTIGFANPTLYAIDRILPFAYRDVVPQSPPQAVAYTSATSGNSYLVSFDTDTSLKTAKRYDDVTGIGGVSFTLLGLLASGRH